MLIRIAVLFLFGIFAPLAGLAQDADESTPARGWALLEQVTSEAPARQVGQPGNEWVDRWTESTFEYYVAKNRGISGAEREQLAAGYDLAVQKILESFDSLALEEVSPALLLGQSLSAGDGSRASLSRSILRRPGPVWFIFSVALICLAVAWWFQRRRGLLLLGGGIVLASLALAIASGLYHRSQAMEIQSGESKSSGIAVTESGKEFLAVPGDTSRWQRGRITSYTGAFVPGESRISVGGQEARIFPMAPNWVEPANLPDGLYRGPVFYAGAADLETLQRFPVGGGLVILDFDSDAKWLLAAELGADAILFVEPAKGRPMSNAQAIQKTSNSTLTIPRFFVERSELDRLLGDGWDQGSFNGKEAELSQQPSRWERLPVHHDWIFIPAEGGGDLSELVHIQTYKDAASIVPELSPGAESATNLVAMVELLERFSEKAPARPVMISAVNDHCNSLQGAYTFASFAFTPSQVFAEELERLDFLHAQKLLVTKVYNREPSEELLEYLRGSIERVGGRSFTLKEPAVNLLNMRRNTLRGRQNQIEFELDSQDLSEEEVRRLREDLRSVRAEVDETVALLGLFNRFGHKTYFSQLNELQRKELHLLFSEIYRQANEDAIRLNEERINIWNNLAFRKIFSTSSAEFRSQNTTDLLSRAFPEVPNLAGFHLDLGTGNSELGFFFVGELRPSLRRMGLIRFNNFASQRVRRLGRLALDVASGLSSDEVSLRNTVLGAEGLQWGAHVAAPRAFASAAFHQFAQNSLTLSTVEDRHPFIYTPDDTLDKISRTKAEALWQWVADFFPAIIDQPNLSETPQSRGASTPLAFEVTVRKMDRFSVEIPRTVLPQAVVSGAVGSTPLDTSAVTVVGQVNPMPVTVADASGRVTLRGDIWRDSSLFAFGFDNSGRIFAAQDMGENERRFSSTLLVTDRMTFSHRSIITFECSKVDVLGFTNPSTLEPVRRTSILDGRTNTPLRNFSINGIDSFNSAKSSLLAFNGSLSVFVPRGVPFKLRAENVLAIHATPENPEGMGFASDQRMVRNLARIMAQDYHLLASERLALLDSKGVSSDVGQAFASEAGNILAKAFSSESPLEKLTLSEIARGFAYQAYTLAISTTNDLIRAVVILLALVVPFCFFLVKLVSPFNDANRQILLFLSVFAFFALLLYFIQPAFSVGERPEVILLAFVILGLAGFVASVILSKFDSAMNQAVEQSQLSESPDAPQGRLAGVAFMVGVNNMKRRRIRTTLTCATIVLVTFTILSVISIREAAEPLRLRVGGDAPYNGLLFIQPGLAPIDPLRIERLEAHFGENASTLSRVWVQRQTVEGFYQPFPISTGEAQSTKTPLRLSILLGLDVAEQDFVADLVKEGILVPGSRWFSSNHADEIILSARTAELLGISSEGFQGHPIRLQGKTYELIGLFNDQAMAEFQDLRKLPMLPLMIDPTAAKDAEGDGGGSNILEAAGVSVVPTTGTALLPIGTAKDMGGATYRVFAAKYLPKATDSDADVVQRLWQDIQNFLRYQQAFISVGLLGPVDRGEDLPAIEPGEYAMASSSGSELGGILKIAIPVILAATIILNTMLGSVLERKKEISIYNAIGLNPSHVMMFFLAEALVFGLVGSIAGYFLGQLLSVGLGQFLDLNLNYSSFSVMVVIFLTILTVLLSTIYPATMAARAAVPSGQRKWSLPAAEGDEIALRFPFSYDAKRIVAICAYLHDFMQLNSEASTGKFLARLRAIGKVPSESPSPDSDGAGEALVMVYNVTPIPFDLGVNQRMEVYADYDSRVKAYMLSLHLHRESGDRESWTTVNQAFLEALRKRLLSWRSQRPEVQAQYLTQGEQLFQNAVQLAVVPSSETERSSLT